MLDVCSNQSHSVYNRNKINKIYNFPGKIFCPDYLLQNKFDISMVFGFR